MPKILDCAQMFLACAVLYCHGCHVASAVFLRSHNTTLTFSEASTGGNDYRLEEVEIDISMYFETDPEEGSFVLQQMISDKEQFGELVLGSVEAVNHRNQNIHPVVELTRSKILLEVRSSFANALEEEQFEVHIKYKVQQAGCRSRDKIGLMIDWASEIQTKNEVQLNIAQAVYTIKTSRKIEFEPKSPSPTNIITDGSDAQLQIIYDWDSKPVNLFFFLSHRSFQPSEEELDMEPVNGVTECASSLGFLEVFSDPVFIAISSLFTVGFIGLVVYLNRIQSNKGAAVIYNVSPETIVVSVLNGAEDEENLHDRSDYETMDDITAVTNFNDILESPASFTLNPNQLPRPVTTEPKLIDSTIISSL